jgi:DNA repair protein SbcC/Rad50
VIPLRLVLQNFLSYGEQAQTLDFTRFHIACLSGANGHGKSALLDAITWSLWGQARKGRHDRKPDEGLLRLGARQMRVEFTFDLDGGTHRVIRSFRRRPSTNVTELELQILNPETNAYRPLAEAGAVGATQSHIDQLLSMDYDTFVNSAFLLQGQANSFTNKGSRERKQLLARILGLTRYDRLQDGARTRQQAQSSELTVLRQRAAACATELEAQPQIEADLAQADADLTNLGARMQHAEDKLQLYRERRHRAVSVRSELQRLTADRTEVEASQQRLAEDVARLQQQRAIDATMLAEADRIEDDVRRYRELSGEAAVLDTRRQSCQVVETAVSDIRRQIESARHQVDQRRATWQARRESLDERLRQFDEVLQNADGIEADLATLMQHRKALETLRRGHRQWEELRATHDKADHAIELEQRRLAERQRGTEARLQEIRERIDAAAEVSQQIESAENDLEAAGKRAEEMRQLREDGTRVRALVEQSRQRLTELETEKLELRERIAALSRGDLTECPLCGTDLDVEHFRRINTEFGEREAQLDTRRQRQEHEAVLLDEQLVDLRSRFRMLEEDVGDLAQRQEHVALLRARRRQLDEDEAAASQLYTEVAGLARQLQSGDFALEARAVKTAAQSSLAELNFDPKRQTELEDLVRDGAEVDANHRLLLGAREDRVQTEAECQQAEGHVLAAQEELGSGSFSRVLDIEHQRLLLEYEAIGYDPEHHARVRALAASLEEAPVEGERLKAARERTQSIDTRLLRLHDERTVLTKRAEALDLGCAELTTEIASLAGVDERCESMQTQVENQRQERDTLLQHQGSLLSRQQHLLAIAEQAASLTIRRSELEHDEWLYRQLAEAFGKDGIQALIIESAIPEIEDEANALLRRLTDNRIQITIESLRDLKGGGSRETLDIKIADELGERSYDLYSGGEAFRTDFAMRIALSKVLARRAGTRLRTLIIDEGFGTQDAHGLEQLTEAIHQIGRDFDKVLVVTHLDELKDAFPVRIEVTKDPNRGSHFDIVD